MNRKENGKKRKIRKSKTGFLIFLGILRKISIFTI